MDDAERYRLHHGPYSAPACRRGDLLECEVLGRDVRVGGTTDAPIPWPRALKSGRPSLIVCGDLVRAVRVESELAISQHWGVGVVTVWKWRKALGVGPINDGTRALYRGHYPAKITPEARGKMAETNRSPEAREHQASLRRGKPAHPNTATALANAARAPRSDEHRKNIANALRGRRGPKSKELGGTMTITTDHAASSYGLPVILDDEENPMDYAPGVRAVRDRLGLTAARLAEACGKSVYAVHQWEQSRRQVPAEALNVMADLLRRHASAEMPKS